MEYRLCTKCQTQKIITDYYWEESRNRYKNVCKICVKNLSSARYECKTDIVKNKHKEWRENNQEQFKNLIKKNRSRYKEYDREYAKIYHKNKRDTDENYRIKSNLRNRFYKTITNKRKSVFEYLGCTIEECKLSLSNNFTSEMSWDNYGSYWEIDHIVPIDSFDLTKSEEIYKCWHYTNLQPLTIKENRIKSNKI